MDHNEVGKPRHQPYFPQKWYDGFLIPFYALTCFGIGIYFLFVIFTKLIKASFLELFPSVRRK